MKKKLMTLLSFSVPNLRALLKQKIIISGAVLVIATSLANVLNMMTNFYLGNALTLSDFALLNTFMSLSYLGGIFFSSVSATVNHKTAILAGRHNVRAIPVFWHRVVNRLLLTVLVFDLIWLVTTPLLGRFLQISTLLPIVTFAPYVLVSILYSVNSGYLKGILRFDLVAIGVIIEPLSRLLLSLVFGYFKLGGYMYLTVATASGLSWLVVFVILLTLNRRAILNRERTEKYQYKELKLPLTFFVLALLAGLASIAFFSLDNILVMHFLGSVEAGKYGLLGLLGKMIFFAGGLMITFVLPLVSYHEGKGKQSHGVFRRLFFLTALLSGLAYVAICLGTPILANYLASDKLTSIQTFLPWYGAGVLFYTLSQSIVQFHLAKRHYLFSIVSLSLASIQIAALWLFHSSLEQIVYVMAGVGIFNFVILTLLHLGQDPLAFFYANVQDFFDLFHKLPNTSRSLKKKESYQILIFNWRDTKHVWAGGAEIYLHELAKQLVRDGHKVTLFCGNDGHCLRSEQINGINIVRRGGFYTVYFWAFLYYVTRFRHKFDLVIDSENGIPFLTPLFVRQPIFLLIHHVHQEIFLTQLPFPLSTIASLIEADLMTILYRRSHVITVSESSKHEILSLGLGDHDSIQVINPGVRAEMFKPRAKTRYPSLIYVGRLKPYKNVHIAIEAFARLATKYPTAKFTIAGRGESLDTLRQQVKQLNLQKQIIFKTRVSDKEKAQLLAKSWIAVQPSMVEGWGITVIEANASGTPVIAANVKGLQDSVVNNETGMLVPVNNVSAMTSAIKSLFDHQKKRDRLAKNAIVWAKKFTWTQSYHKLITLITALEHESMVYQGTALAKAIGK